MKKVNFDVKLPAFVDRIVYVDNYGARPYCYTIEDASRNADAINRAINYISEKGGGTVVIPEGIWFTAPIEIKSDVELRIEKNAILKFSKDIDQYPLIITNYEGQECIRAKSPITAENASERMDFRFLPPVKSSPFPRYRYFPKSIALVQNASVGSHTRLARSLVSSPSE